MKSNGKKLAVAWIVTIAMIVAAVFIGLRKGGDTPAPPKPQDMGLDMSLSTKQFQNHILDSAGVLSAKQKETICLYNANWNQRYGSIIMVATTNTVGGVLDDFAYDLGESVELAAADAVLAVNPKTVSAYLAPGPDYPLSGGQITSYLDNSFFAYVDHGSVGDGILNLFADLNTYYVDNYGLGYLDNSSGLGGERSGRRCWWALFYCCWWWCSFCPRWTPPGTAPTAPVTMAWWARRPSDPCCFGTDPATAGTAAAGGGPRLRPLGRPVLPDRPSRPAAVEAGSAAFPGRAGAAAAAEDFPRAALAEAEAFLVAPAAAALAAAGAGEVSPVEGAFPAVPEGEALADGKADHESIERRERSVYHEYDEL